jgi:hypothetical protein
MVLSSSGGHGETADGSCSYAKIKAELRRRMHDPVTWVGEWLKRVTLGHYNY